MPDRTGRGTSSPRMKRRGDRPCAPVPGTVPSPRSGRGIDRARSDARAPDGSEASAHRRRARRRARRGSARRRCRRAGGLSSRFDERRAGSLCGLPAALRLASRPWGLPVSTARRSEWPSAALGAGSRGPMNPPASSHASAAARLPRSRSTSAGTPPPSTASWSRHRPRSISTDSEPRRPYRSSVRVALDGSPSRARATPPAIAGQSMRCCATLPAAARSRGLSSARSAPPAARRDSPNITHPAAAARDSSRSSLTGNRHAAGPGRAGPPHLQRFNPSTTA